MCCCSVLPCSPDADVQGLFEKVRGALMRGTCTQTIAHSALLASSKIGNKLGDVAAGAATPQSAIITGRMTAEGVVLDKPCTPLLESPEFQELLSASMPRGVYHLVFTSCSSNRGMLQEVYQGHLARCRRAAARSAAEEAAASNQPGAAAAAAKAAAARRAKLDAEAMVAAADEAAAAANNEDEAARRATYAREPKRTRIDG